MCCGLERRKGGEGGGGIGRKGFLGVGRNGEERKENSMFGNGNGKWEHHPCLHPSAVGRQPSGTALPGPAPKLGSSPRPMERTVGMDGATESNEGSL